MLILKIVAPNGKITAGKVNLHALIKVGAGYRYELVDSQTLLVPDDLRLKRIGNKLVLRSESQATTVELVNFYPHADNLPTTASVSLPGAPLGMSESVAMLPSEPQSTSPSVELTQMQAQENALAENMSGLDLFDEPLQYAQAGSPFAGPTMTDVLAQAGAAGAAGAGEAGAAAGSGAAGAGAAAGSGAGAAAGAAAAIGGVGGIALAAAGIGLVAAAGGGGAAATSAAVVVAPVLAAGVAIDGYLSNARVFRDTNNNKLWDNNETFVITDSNGNWSGLGGTGKIVLTAMLDANGNSLTKDISTGNAYNQVLTAPEGSTVITPLTTLLTSLVDKGLTLAQAEDKVADALGLDTTISLSTYDPVKTITATGTSAADQTKALAVQKATIQLASILTVAAEAAKAVDTTQTSAKNTVAVFDALANSVQNTVGVVNLGGSTAIQAVFDGIANSIDPAKKASMQTLDDKLVTSLASINTAISSVTNNDGATSALTQIVSNQIVASSNLVTATKTAVSTSSTVNDANFTGANLINATDTAIQSVQTITQVTNTVTAVGAPLRPMVTVDAGTTFDSRLTTSDIETVIAGNGVHVKVALDATSKAAVGDRLVLQMNGTALTALTKTLTANDLLATLVFDLNFQTLGQDGSKTFVAHLERGTTTTTIGPDSLLASTTVDTAATAPSSLDLIAADDTGVSATDNFTSKTTIRIQGTAEAGASVVVSAGAVNSPAAIANSSGVFEATLTGVAAGVRSVTAVATDVAGNSASSTVPLSVTVSTAPTVANALTAQSVNQSAPFSFVVPANTFADVDAGDALTYSATGLPTGITINASTGAFSGSASQASVGNNNVVVTVTDKAGLTVTNGFALTVVNVNDAPTGAVTVSGTPTQNQTLSAVSTTLADLDGLGTLSYVWKASGTTIPNATASTLVLAEAQVGKTITVTASYTDGFGAAESVTSTATAAVANVNDAPTGAVTIMGTQAKNQTLMAEAFNVSDPDGLGTFSYQWQSSATANGTFANIASATSQTYMLVPGDIGRFVRVVTSYTDGHGTVETVNSSPTGAILDNQPPTGTVTINGTVIEDGTVTASNTIADADGMGPNPITYQWQSSANGTTWADVSTGSSITLTSDALVGKQLRVQAKYTDGLGTPEAPASAGAVVVNINDPMTGGVTISGTATQNQTLTANNTLADADGLGTLSYQWKADGTNIGAASASNTLVLAEAQVGKVITVVASYTDLQLTPESATSAGTSAVVNVNDPGSVSIGGTATQGQTLTATASDVDGFGAAIPTTYLWKADGADIGVAGPANTLVLAEAQVGKVITVVANYVDGHGTPETPASTGTTAVLNVDDVPTGAVTITGIATQNQTLTAANTLADIDGLGAISYKWQANGTDISGATSSTLVLAQAQVLKTITVTASYTDGHGKLESVASTATGAVVNVNDAPTVTSGGTATVAENAVNTTVIYTATATDPDGDTLAYSLGGTDAALFNIVSGTGVVTLKTSADFEAKPSYSFDVIATDPGLLPSTKAVVLSVTNVNEAPILIHPLLDTNAATNSVFNYMLHGIVDPDAGDTLSYTATQVGGAALPAWLTFNGTTGVFGGTPTAANIGTVHVHLTAKDTGNLSVSDDFDIGVADNAAPVVVTPPPFSPAVSAGTNLNLASLFTDTEALTYSITSGTLPTGLNLNSSTGIISGTVLPANVAAPTAVTIQAVDSLNPAVSTSLKLYVSEVGAVQASKISGGTTLVLDFLVDEALNPGGLIPGLESLGVTVQYDSTKLHYVSSSGVAQDLFLGGVASEVAGKGSIDISEAWLATPVTGHPGRVMQVTFNVLQAGDVRVDILPTDFDGIDLSAKATHAWFATT